MDAIYLLLAFGLFVLSLVLVHLCARLGERR